jgi:hypothetical protein
MIRENLTHCRRRRPWSGRVAEFQPFDPHDTPRVRLVRSAPRAVLRLRCGGSDRLWRTQRTRTGRTADVADDRDCWALSAFRFIRADQRDPQSKPKRFEPGT